MSERRARFIEITNFRGVTNAQITFGKPQPGKGQLITITGLNEAGKTSLLQGVTALLAGGHNPKAIRDGADKAELRMLLSDGTDITRTITQKASTAKATPAEGPEIKKIETFLKTLASGCGFDPLLFILEKDKRLKFITDAMADQLVFDAGEVTAAIGDASKAVELPAVYDLNTVGKLIKDLTEARARFGSRRDEKSGAAESLRKSLFTSDQADDPKDWKAELARLESSERAQRQAEAKDVSLIEGQIRDVAKELSGSIREFDDAAKTVFDSFLKAAREGKWNSTEDAGELLVHLESLSNLVVSLAEANKNAQEAIDKVRSESATKLAALAGEIATAKAGADSQVKDDGTREQMNIFSKDAAALGKQWEACQVAIKAIEGLKASKLNSLPVEGLDIRDGEIFIHGRQFDELNTAMQYRKAFEIGKLGVGEIALMVCDKTEHLDPIAWEEFEQAVIASGVYVLAARGITSRVELEAHGGQLRSEPAEALKVA